jgi:hypothetical protein
LGREVYERRLSPQAGERRLLTLAGKEEMNKKAWRHIRES